MNKIYKINKTNKIYKVSHNNRINKLIINLIKNNKIRWKKKKNLMQMQMLNLNIFNPMLINPIQIIIKISKLKEISKLRKKIQMIMKILMKRAIHHNNIA